MWCVVWLVGWPLVGRSFSVDSYFVPVPLPIFSLFWSRVVRDRGVMMRYAGGSLRIHYDEA